MITGVDIAYADLEKKKPEAYEPGPTENPGDESVAMDADENLPWPDAELVRNWWESNKDRFQAGRRYLRGRLIAPAGCEEGLLAGYQRQRMAAALELARHAALRDASTRLAPGVAVKTLNRAT